MSMHAAVEHPILWFIFCLNETIMKPRDCSSVQNLQTLYRRTGNVGLRLKKYPDQLTKHFGVSLKVKRRNLSGINLKNAVSNPVSLLWAPQAPLQGNSPSQGQLDWQEDIRTEDTEQHPVLHSKLHQSTKSVQSQPLVFHQVPRWLRVELCCEA